MRYYWFISIILSLLLTSCSDANDDLARYIKEVKQRKTRAIEPIPVFPLLQDFKFPDEKTRRNPFKTTRQTRFVDSYVPDQRRIKQPLEAFPLDALKFVGTLIEENQIWGLIKQPDSYVMRVRVGDYMGQNYGRLLFIKNNFIQLEEKIKNASGRWDKRITILELYTGK